MNIIIYIMCNNNKTNVAKRTCNKMSKCANTVLNSKTMPPSKGRDPEYKADFPTCPAPKMIGPEADVSKILHNLL